MSTEYYNITNLNGCFIYNLCIHKNYRNNKKGLNLLNYTIEKVLELKIDYLHTHAETDISRKLFIKSGFIEKQSFISMNYKNVYCMSKNLVSLTN